jgi:hypothetical protein
MRTLVGALMFVVFLLAALSSTLAEEFYSGKNVRFIVGFAAGGGYDAYTRMVARYLSRYVVLVTVSGMLILDNLGISLTPLLTTLGIGSLVAANYLYKQANPDGLTIGVFNNSLIVQARGGRIRK